MSSQWEGDPAIPPITGISFSTKATQIVNVEVILRPTVSRPFCPGIRPPSVTRDQFFFQFHGKYFQMFAGFFLWGALPTSAVTLEVQVPQDSRPCLTASLETKSPFCRLLCLAGLRWRYSPPPTPPYNVLARTSWKVRALFLCPHDAVEARYATEPSLSIDCCIVACITVTACNRRDVYATNSTFESAVHT
jgi:hypothetical protein